MSIHNVLVKIKTLDSGAKERVFVVFLIILVGVASFGLGRLSTLDHAKVPVHIESFASPSPEVLGSSTVAASAVFASKTGTTYYYPSCTGTTRIAEKNKITFSSAKEAEAFGLHIGPGCKSE